MRDLLAAGEDVVAYEVLCDNLYEIDLRPPADLERMIMVNPVLNEGAVTVANTRGFSATGWAPLLPEADGGLGDPGTGQADS